MLLWLVIIVLVAGALYGGLAVNPLLLLLLLLALFAFVGGPGVGRYRGRGWW